MNLFTTTLVYSCKLSLCFIFDNLETSPFVEKLFRCLESESYMKGEDPPKSPPSSSAHVPARVVERVSENVHSSSRNEERRHSEDFRHKEVGGWRSITGG